MDTFTPKTILIITLGGCLLICSLFFYLIYIPNRTLIDKNIADTKEVAQKIHVESSQVTKLQKEIMSFDSPNIYLNYFNRLHLSESERIPHLLKKLTAEANTLGIKFISVDPQPSKKNSFYEKYVFRVEVQAAQYSQMVRFFHCIENKLKLNIDEMSIQQDAENSNQLYAKISLNTLETHDSLLKNFYTITQVKNFYHDPNWPNKNIKAPNSLVNESEKKSLMAQAIKRNPFEPSLMLSPLLSNKEKALQVKKNDVELVLSAIMDFQGERIAIIGNNPVKKGESLKNIQVGNRYIDLEVLEIEENSITLGDGQNKYTFKLPDNPITF